MPETLVPARHQAALPLDRLIRSEAPSSEAVEMDVVFVMQVTFGHPHIGGAENALAGAGIWLSEDGDDGDTGLGAGGFHLEQQGYIGVEGEVAAIAQQAINADEFIFSQPG